MFSIGDYVKAYRTSGLAGLDMGCSTGRRPMLTPEQEQKVYETVRDKTPAEVGQLPQ
ncbi:MULTISPECIES: helix-turn-helix domain-containing protein [Mesobacillus]|uniref:Transposase n=1 Tax=Mesobacillus stamsii TaxID=225347 RepID=A0ABU0FY82_9BACI|nr:MULTISPECIES: helix-turn-helix domain-containing protein [Mesobacillus]MDQ0414903.1 transposase [Mesobacillus stamsii]